MYLGTKAGDSVKLAWNTTSFAYPTLEDYIPFDDENDLTISVIQNIHEISEKIDHILFIETFVSNHEQSFCLANVIFITLVIFSSSLNN